MSYNESKCPDCTATVLVPRSRPELMLELGRKVVICVPDLASGHDIYQDCAKGFVVHECNGAKARKKSKAKEKEPEAATEG